MAHADLSNTYRRHARLVDTLPPLVRKQRRLAAKLAPLEDLIEQDKSLRKNIDALITACGYAKGEGVTCLGYDVVHREREGNTSYDVVLLGSILVEKLVALGVARDDVGTPGDPKSDPPTPPSADYVPGAETFVVEMIAMVRSKGDTSKWAEVKPMKGAKVRA
ncbi:MAG TPA: hypothetical protein VGR82_17485 [Methylomirabilota bacterium]|jgi:hypothetical protein|nr:hypothetical protein [Methylomirabilota bacterium]